MKFSAVWLALSLMFIACRAHVVDYLISFPKETIIRAVAGYSGGWFEVQSEPMVNVSNYGHIDHEIFNSYPLVADSDNKTILMKANHVYLYVGTGNSIYSPLRTYANGKKYIVSTCIPAANYKTMLVVASHTNTNVTITFKVEGSVQYDGKTYSNGQTMTMSLAENRTFSMETDQDLTGTVVMATQTVAVYSGLTYTVDSMTHIVAYEQLLSVMHFGMEYVVAVDDSSTDYKLQVFADNEETVLQFKGREDSNVAAGDVHNETLSNIKTLHFTSTKPVLATLCRLNGMKSGFTVVPPVDFYSTRKSLYVDQGDTAKIVTKKTDMNPRMQVNETTFVDFTWSDIADSEYHVGTRDFSDAGSYGTINSNHTFIVFVYGENRIYNAGSNIPRPPTPTTQQAATPEATTFPVGKGNRIDGFFTIVTPILVFVLYQLC